MHATIWPRKPPDLLVVLQHHLLSLRFQVLFLLTSFFALITLLLCLSDIWSGLCHLLYSIHTLSLWAKVGWACYIAYFTFWRLLPSFIACSEWCALPPIIVLGIDLTDYAGVNVAPDDTESNASNSVPIEAIGEKDMIVDLTSANMDPTATEPTVEPTLGTTWWNVNTGANSMVTNQLDDLISPIAINAVARTAQKGVNV